MDWTKFNTHGESCNHAFEVMCNLLFEAWCKKEYGKTKVNVTFVNGDGGDGGVEAYATLSDGNVVGVQSKWFREKLESSQIGQINSSFTTALAVRPQIVRYIVCIPRDLGSKRIVKGGKISKNTEENRWLGLKDTFKKIAPDVVVDLWDETRIQEMLTWPELVGISKYWFDTSEIFDDYFEISYKKAISSWARTKYIPDLYAEGYIHQRIEFFLGSYSLSERRSVEWQKMLERLVLLKRSFEDLLKLEFPKTEKDLVEKIKIDISTVAGWISFLERKEDSVKRGIAISFEKNFELCCSAENIKNSSLHFHRYFHFNSVEKLLDNIINDFYYFKNFLSDCYDNRLILLGNPGCGKTTSIVSEVAEFLEKKTHLPILVHAKDFSNGETWTSIIGKTLGLSLDWDENELLFSLQSSAQIRQSNDRDKLYDIVPKCVICVDGIDEADSWDFWKNRIEEVDAFRELYPRVKFIFLSRPYVFNEKYKLSDRNDISNIPFNGDVDPAILCETYFKEYKINIGKNRWIKTLLKSPMAVKLFCDIYQDTNVEKIDNNTTVITKLFHKKIELLEEWFDKQVKVGSKGSVQNVLCEAAQLFVEKENLPENELLATLGESITRYLPELLKFLEEEGFINSFKRQKDDFSPVVTYYSWGMQPALDYLIARKLYAALKNEETIKVEYTTGIYEMLSLILIEEDGKLLFQYPNIKVDESTMFDLISYTLSSASIKAVTPYRNYLKKLMGDSVYHFRELVNKVVIPVSNVSGHPLGAELLDEFLREFDSPAERDIWWSIPGYLRDIYKTDWRACIEISFEDITLREDNTADSITLILAWSLSSVNNEVRQHSRMELVTWGIKNPDEFWKLFLKLADIDDDQILEDLFAVAYGIALDQFATDEYIKEFSAWILENVFSPSGLRRYENSALRYYSSSVVKIAISRKLEDESVRTNIIPPYSYESDGGAIAIEAVTSERMGGYKAIDYDLARYVLCNHLDVFFRINYKKKSLEGDSANFIDKYKEKYNITELSVDGLIISMAYQYLTSHGWNPDVFWKYDDAENVGVDIAIHRTHFPATHGSMSRIMTVAEKNVWLARHHIECILSNEIVYRGWSSDKHEALLDDYSYLENFINPYQDYVNKNHYETAECWFHMDLLARSEEEMSDVESIEKWMKNGVVPDFESWLMGYDNSLLLHTFTNAVNNFAGIEEAIWVSTGIVNKQKLSKLIECLNEYSEERMELLNSSGFHAEQDCSCYCTPQEACIVRPDKEIYSNVIFHFNEDDIEVKAAAASCLSSDEMDVEKEYFLPSSIIRQFTGITFGDGYEYKDYKGEVVATFYSNGENLGTKQEILLIKKDVFLKVVEENGFTPFWIFRVYKSPSNKAYERYPEILHDTDKTFFVWLEEGIRYLPLEEIEPPICKVDNTGADLKDRLLAQLGYAGEEKDEYGK